MSRNIYAVGWLSPGSRKGVTLSVGLVGGGLVARTIIGSFRPARTGREGQHEEDNQTKRAKT
jgi:hypothetical protein